jgi:hypothetical protein
VEEGTLVVQIMSNHKLLLWEGYHRIYCVFLLLYIKTGKNLFILEEVHEVEREARVAKEFMQENNINVDNIIIPETVNVKIISTVATKPEIERYVIYHLSF